MPFKRSRRSKPTSQTLDEYESTSSSDLDTSSDIDFQRPEAPILRSSQRKLVSDRRKSACNLLGRATITTILGARPRRATVSSDTDVVGPNFKNRVSQVNQNPYSNAKAYENPSVSKKRKCQHASSAYALKKLELEMAWDAERRRQSMIRTLCDKIMSSLLSKGDISRDVVQICSKKFNWDFREWKDILKGGKVALHDFFENDHFRRRSHSSVKCRGSIGSNPWDPALEVDGITLCILRSEGIRVTLPARCYEKKTGDHLPIMSPDWDTIDSYSELRFLFVHRKCMKDFFSEKQTSLVDLTRLKPRLQIFVFGSGKELAPIEADIADPKIELVLCAGAVIIPTFDSLFRKVPGQDQPGKMYFDRLKHLCLVNPFVKVCLHPSMQHQLQKRLSLDVSDSMVDTDFLIDFLGHSFDSPKGGKINSLGDWIQLDRNIICWLWSEIRESQNHQEPCEESSEFRAIMETMKTIRSELYGCFRRFMIVLPEEHPQSNKKSIEGIELITVHELSDSFARELP